MCVSVCVFEGVEPEEPEEYSLDYCGMAKFTQESLLSCDPPEKVGSACLV